MAIAEKTVSHPGIIKRIEGKTVQVSVISKAGCGSCQLKSACSVGEVKEKVVEIEVENVDWRAGEQVTVEMKQSLGTMAVLLGYVFPFIVILIGLILFLRLGLDQGIAGIFSLLLLVPYYGGLYLSKGYLRKKFQYRIY